MGHPGPNTLEHLVNSVEGARIKGVTTVECEACALAKIKRQIRRQPRDLQDAPRTSRIAIDFHDFEEDGDGFSSIALLTERRTGYI